jgi:hypothetical protein
LKVEEKCRRLTWRRKPLKPLKTDSEMAPRQSMVAAEEATIRRNSYQIVNAGNAASR